ncbi:MAG: hypothetical protein HC822_14710 [Oscillochloris sp.]|nr:hypothetical protein [Oscillochloris sp.]
MAQLATTQAEQRRADRSHDPRPFAVRRFRLLLGMAILVLAALLVLHIVVGTLSIAPRDILLALLNQAADPLHRQVVWGLRLRGHWWRSSPAGCSAWPARSCKPSPVIRWPSRD